MPQFIPKSIYWIPIIIVSILAGWLTGRFGLYLLLTVLILGAAILLILLLERPKQLVYISIATVVLGQFGRLPPGSANGNLLVIDIFVGLTFLAWILQLVSTKKLKDLKEIIFLSPAHLVWLSFLAVALLALLANPLQLPKKELLQNSLYWIRLVSYTSFIWIIPNIFHTDKEIKSLYNWLIKCGLAVILLGFIQLYIFPNIGPLAKYGWDPHVGRLVSSFLDPNYLGGFMAIILALLIAPTIIEKKPLIWIPIILTLIAALLTYSRSGYIAVAIVVLIFGIRYSWKLMLITVICVIPIGLSIPRISARIIGGFSIDQTAQDRIKSWNDALTVSKAYPILGVGFNSYQSAQKYLGIVNFNDNVRSIAGSDSSFLNVLATTGIVGLALATSAILMIFKKGFKMVKLMNKNRQTSVALSILTFLPALFVHSFFVNGFFYPFILILLVSLGGLLYAETTQKSLLP